MVELEWLKDERGEVYIPRRGCKITCNDGIVLASVMLNETAYAKLMSQVNKSDKRIGVAIL